MSTMRGLIPSLGAGGSLIAAALCAVAVFGGMLAFRGDRPGTAEANSGDLAMPAGDVRAATDARRPPRPASVAARRTVAHAAARTRARRGGAVAVPAPTAAAPRMTVPARPSPSPSQPPPPSRSPRPADPEPTTTPPPVEAPGTVQGAVAKTRSVAKPVVDAAPAPAQAPVEQVADTVEQVAATVDEVTRVLLP